MEIALNSVVASSPSSASSSSSTNSSFDNTTINDNVSKQERNLSYQNCLRKTNEGIELLASNSLQNNTLNIDNIVNNNNSINQNNYNTHQKRIQQPKQQNPNSQKKPSKTQTKLTQQSEQPTNFNVISSLTTALAGLDDTTIKNNQNTINCFNTSTEDTIINNKCSNNITNKFELKLYSYDIKPNIHNLFEQTLILNKPSKASKISSKLSNSLSTTSTNVNPFLPLSSAQKTPSTPTSTTLTKTVSNACVVNNGSGCNNGSSSSTNGNGSVVNIKQTTFKIPSDILDDLASRFIINVPDMELSNLIRICFQIELAHWFYLDFFCASEDEDVKLPTCGIKQFAMQIFQHIPFLQTHLSSVDKILEDWKNYKLAVPTFGAILISEDLKYCLLVQSYFAKSSWGFPKGKVNENEDPVHCAIREVYEETSFDITNLIVPKDYIEAVINYQYTRLYIVRNVPLDTQFTPRTRNEIKCCDWFPIDSLPINKSDAISKTKLGINANSFFMILPFMKRLKKWVNDKRAGIETTMSRRKCSGSSYAIGMCGSPPTSSSSPVGYKSSNHNQKQLIGINSCKKNKQSQQQYTNKTMNSDDILALHNMESSDENIVEKLNGNESAFSEETLTETTKILINLSTNLNESAVNNAKDCFVDNYTLIGSTAATMIATTNKTPINNQCSKRQRHKSMGDLDGVKLTNFNNRNQINVKTKPDEAISNSNNINYSHIDDIYSASINMISSSITMTTTTNSVGNNNYKRNSNKIGAAGSNSICLNTGSPTVIGNTMNVNANLNSKNGCINTISTTVGNNIPSKRQLFHSQSHNGTPGTQQEKHCSGLFEVIRKEKQQQIQTKSKCQKQQLNGNNNGRIRAKSHCEKICGPQQQNKTTTTLNQNICNNAIKSRLQRQKSLSYTTSSLINNNDSNENINQFDQNSNITSSYMDGLKNDIQLENCSTNQKVVNDKRSFTGLDLIALIEANSTTKINFSEEPTTNPTKLSNTVVLNDKSGYGLVKSASTSTTPKLQYPLEQRKQRPVSASLNFENSTFQIEKLDQEQQSGLQESQLKHQKSSGVQRNASGTNLRYLRRSISHHQQKQSTSASTSAASELEQSQQPKPFSPNNSWKNFSFTKNFISNVFC